LGIAPPPESVEKAVKMIRTAKRPVIIVGYGARSAMDIIVNLGERLKAPIITTFKAKGLIPDDHPLACGVLGRSGTPVAGWFMSQSDLLIVFGASFAQHTGILKDRPIIQVDFDRMTLGKFHPVSTPVWGEVGVTAKQIFEEISNNAPPEFDARKEVAERWDLWRKKKKDREGEDQGKGLNSALVIGAMNHYVPENAIISVDVGNNTYSFGRYFECSAQSIIMSGYLGSIGFGYPGAIGAWAAAPNRPVVAVTGDGGFAQYMAEVTTAVKYGIPIKHILLNNAELGKITNEQRDAGKPVWETGLANPNFAEFAENCGALGIRVTDREQLDEGMDRVFAHRGPAMLEVIADPELT
jgi:thiamine pyrophosphate-dependent acetolactate synthase large subunit-like protein